MAVPVVVGSILALTQPALIVSAVVSPGTMLDGDNMKTLWNSSKPLTAVGLLMLVAFVFSAVGVVMDPRVITGAPAWLKPAKFAISTAIYSLTLAWVFTYLPDWPRLESTTGWITALVFVLEVTIIDVQAARGTTSHFNVSTPVDASLFGIMGFAILIVWLTSAAVTVALFRQQFSDRAMGWALRLGLLITVLGSATGGLMVRPTGAQLANAQATHRMPISGAHTVGAPDGGPGIPGTGWSREHGDMRVPHFFGMHAMQILPIFACLLGRNRPRLVIAASSGYAMLFVLLIVQALEGRPFLGGVL